MKKCLSLLLTLEGNNRGQLFKEIDFVPSNTIPLLVDLTSKTRIEVRVCSINITSDIVFIILSCTRVFSDSEFEDILESGSGWRDNYV